MSLAEFSYCRGCGAVTEAGATCRRCDMWNPPAALAAEWARNGPPKFFAHCSDCRVSLPRECPLPLCEECWSSALAEED